MITCFLRYEIVPSKISDFEVYAERWIRLVNRFGGDHHGYFLPSEGASHVALALFTFGSLAEYETYRCASSEDADCQEALRHAEDTGCIVHYERSFFRHLSDRRTDDPSRPHG